MKKLQRDSLASRLRILRNRYKDKIIWWGLVACLCVTVCGSVFPLVGSALESLKFAGPTLLLAVALILFDAVTNEPSIDDDAGKLVIARPSGLLPFMIKASERKGLNMTFVGYSSETLYGLLSELFAHVEENRKGLESIHIRVLIPDCSLPMSMPCLRASLEDYPPYRALSQRRSDEFCGKIRRAVSRLAENRVVKRGTFEVKYHRLTPLLKVYMLNDDAVFWGLYPIEASAYVEADGGETQVLDLKGTRTSLIGAVAERGGRDVETIRSLSGWIESVWSSAALPAKASFHE